MCSSPLHCSLSGNSNKLLKFFYRWCKLEWLIFYSCVCVCVGLLGSKMTTKMDPRTWLTLLVHVQLNFHVPKMCFHNSFQQCALVSSMFTVPRFADRNVSVIFYGYSNQRQSTSTFLCATTIRETIQYKNVWFVYFNGLIL